MVRRRDPAATRQPGQQDTHPSGGGRRGQPGLDTAGPPVDGGHVQPGGEIVFDIQGHEQQRALHRPQDTVDAGEL